MIGWKLYDWSHLSRTVTNDDDGMSGVEGDMIELGFLPRHHLLDTDWLVFVPIEVIHMNLAINGHCSPAIGQLSVRLLNTVF